KIICIGFNIHGTGLTRVMHAIMRRLADRHEIHYLGIGYSGETIRDRGLTIHPTNPRGGDVFAAFQAKQMIEETGADLLFILHDIWCFEHYLKILGPFRDRLRIVCYIPLDGRIVDEENAAALQGSDRVVVYTEFAKSEFEAAFARLGEKRGGEFPAVDVIPHGIDRDRFFPFPQLLQASFASSARAGAKRDVFAGLAEPENSFIVLNASRPDIRKRIDLTIEGFARFADGKPGNVRLCLHHAVAGPEPVQDQIRGLIRGPGLADRIMLNPLAAGVADDATLNLLYNACDAGINTSMGEGWGLVSFEHGAAGGAQIVPAHSACTELWRGRGELIEPARRYIPEFSVLEMAEVSADGVAQALENLYRDPQHRRQLAQAAYRSAINPDYSWDSIAARFDDLFAKIVW
ncbi:MAG TPA: glycosyltransferase family 4 protein, partial [Bradyrhizobium sp.]|nr:glycosyltransferase family 4 protein [Bradyrhizobium sp.]